MKNNKGMSLAELIIAVGLISVVMVFLYSFMSDIKNEIDNSNFAINNQVNRFEIIKTVQNDMLDANVTKVELSTDDKAITIEYSDGTSTVILIEYTDNTITVTTKEDVTTKWEMDEDCFIGSNIVTTISETNETFYINIPIYTTNESNSSTNNNVLDDITIYYVND